jgi:short subunit dehydrogenase-like uncharacterized protein
MADRRIVVFGATGYTGRFVAERLAAAGVAPVLAGRNLDRLHELADRIGGAGVVKADVMRQNSVFDLVQEGDVLVSLVGPFVKWGDPAVRAAIAAKAVYVDSTGEPAFIRRVFEEFGPPAERAGASLLTAMGFDWVPGLLAGALAVREAGEDAVRVDVGYYTLGAGPPSAGTKESMIGVTLDKGFAFRGGRLTEDRLAARRRSFHVKGREREAVSVPSAEHFTLPAAFPHLRDVDVYLSVGPFSRAIQAATLANSVLTRLPGAKPLMRFAGEQAAGLLPTAEPGETAGALSWVAAVASDASGEALAEVHVSGADPYEFTAAFIAWAARRAASAGVEGTGALSPVNAFGLDALEQGAAEAGLERLPDPARA